MKVHVDATACSGYGACVDLCPSMFELDDFGYAAVKQDGVVAAGDEEGVKSAVDACPEHAISLQD